MLKDTPVNPPAKTLRPSRRPKKRANRKRRDWNRPLRRAAVLLLVLEIGAALFASPRLRVTQVRVDGAQTLTTQQVFAEAQVPARANIFWLALRAPFVRRLQADPVIDHAARRIELPNTLVLQVWERQPYATLALNGAFWLLDRRGVPYRRLDAPARGVPLIAFQPTASARDAGGSRTRRC